MKRVHKSKGNYQNRSSPNPHVRTVGPCGRPVGSVIAGMIAWHTLQAKSSQAAARLGPGFSIKRKKYGHPRLLLTNRGVVALVVFSYSLLWRTVPRQFASGIAMFWIGGAFVQIKVAVSGHCNCLVCPKLDTNTQSAALV